MKFPINGQETNALSRNKVRNRAILSSYSHLWNVESDLYADRVCARTGLFLETWFKPQSFDCSTRTAEGWILSYMLFEAHARQIGFSIRDYGRSSDLTNLFGMIGTYTLLQNLYFFTKIISCQD